MVDLRGKNPGSEGVILPLGCNPGYRLNVVEGHCCVRKEGNGRERRGNNCSASPGEEEGGQTDGRVDLGYGRHEDDQWAHNLGPCRSPPPDQDGCRKHRENDDVHIGALDGEHHRGGAESGCQKDAFPETDLADQQKDGHEEQRHKGDGKGFRVRLVEAQPAQGQPESRVVHGPTQGVAGVLDQGIEAEPATFQGCRHVSCIYEGGWS